MTGAGSLNASAGVSSRAADTLLVSRARDVLASGPLSAPELIRIVCGLPAVPGVVATHMARALFADLAEFVEDANGLWRLAPILPPAPEPTEVRRDRLATYNYAVVDVETTGSRAYDGDRITEIAVVVVRDGVVADRFETLINPERSIPPMITAITNITWAMVKDAPRFRDVCADVLRQIEGRVFVAHNAEFDWRFVSAEVERATGRRLDGPRLCTVRLARRLLPQLRSRRLDSVALHYGVEITGRHRAGGDADATARVLLRLLADARERECMSWEDLQRLIATRARTHRRRPPAMPRPMDRDAGA